MPDTLESQDTTELVPDGPLVISYPFAALGDATAIVATQKYFIQSEFLLPPTPADSITFDTTTLYFAGDTEPRADEAGLVSFERSWASIPATRTEPETYVATFPGILLQRSSFSRSVTSILTLEFFYVGAGETYATAEEIPTVPAQEYLYDGDSAPRSPDGFFLNDNVLDPTTPTATDYVALIDDDEYNIVAEDSSLTRYLGNIFMRSTRRVKAQ